MKLRHCLRRRLTVPKFVLVLFMCGFLALSFVNKVFADDWEGCDCSSGGAQTWVFTGDMNCDNIHFVWCPNCEPDIAGYLIEYKEVPSEPTGIIGPDNWREPWPGTGLDQGASPIMMWNPGHKPPDPENINDLELTDEDRPEIILSGAENGKYYVFILRAVDTEGFMSGASDENSGLAVCGPSAPQDLLISF